MIPQVGWFHDVKRDFGTSNDRYLGWLNILIGTDNTRVESGVADVYTDQWETNVFSLPRGFVIGGLYYWRDMMVELSRGIDHSPS